MANKRVQSKASLMDAITSLPQLGKRMFMLGADRAYRAVAPRPTAATDPSIRKRKRFKTRRERIEDEVNYAVTGDRSE